MRKLTLIILTMLLLFAVHSYAEIPKLINYQGRLSDSQGRPITGTKTVKFRLYDQQAGGAMLWEETQSVTIDKGVFNAVWGGVTALNLAFDKPYYLELVVEGEVFSPRQQLASSAYAFRANVADDALQAQNANKVANVEVSITPQANKLLPLDANAKLPASTLGLKIYDSGWFAIGANTNITKDHNLGTEKVIVQFIGATSNDGTGPHYLVQPYHDLRAGGDRDGLRVAVTTTQITVFTTDVGLTIWRDNGNEQYIRSLRIIMLALE